MCTDLNHLVQLCWDGLWQVGCFAVQFLNKQNYRRNSSLSGSEITPWSMQVLCFRYPWWIWEALSGRMNHNPVRSTKGRTWKCTLPKTIFLVFLLLYVMRNEQQEWRAWLWRAWHHLTCICQHPNWPTGTHSPQGKQFPFMRLQNLPSSWKTAPNKQFTTFSWLASRECVQFHTEF